MTQFKNLTAVLLPQKHRSTEKISASVFLWRTEIDMPREFQSIYAKKYPP
jgi:hypothetical protein